MDEPRYHLGSVVHAKGETLEDFDGPLDVILLLLSKNKIEIQDISISSILEQYLAWLDERNDALDAVAAELKCRPEDAAGRIADIKAGAREAEAKLKQALLGGSSDKIQAAMGAAIDCGSYKAVIARMDGLEAGELREAWDAIRDKANGGDVACFLATATPEGKVALLAAATDGAVKAGFGAGDVIRKAAEHVGGRGGGRPNMAQAGGKDAAGIEAALAAAREMLA